MRNAGDPSHAGGDSGITHDPNGPPSEDSAPRSRAPAARPDAALAAGAHIGRYILLHRQGSGGMGYVYAAFDPKLDRKVALKVLRPRKAKGHRAQAQQRMLREAQALARLSHPNVVAIHDVGLEADQLFMAMDFVEGQTRAVGSRPSHAAGKRSYASTLARVEASRALTRRGSCTATSSPTM